MTDEANKLYHRAYNRAHQRALTELARRHREEFIELRTEFLNQDPPPQKETTPPLDGGHLTRD